MDGKRRHDPAKGWKQVLYIMSRSVFDMGKDHVDFVSNSDLCQNRVSPNLARIANVIR